MEIDLHLNVTQQADMANCIKVSFQTLLHWLSAISSNCATETQSNTGSTGTNKLAVSHRM